MARGQTACSSLSILTTPRVFIPHTFAGRTHPIVYLDRCSNLHGRGWPAYHQYRAESIPDLMVGSLYISFIFPYSVDGSELGMDPGMGDEERR